MRTSPREEFMMKMYDTAACKSPRHPAGAFT
jgi:hypothetical protein